MTRLWTEGEPISVESDSQGRPVWFHWQGRLHRLRRVEQQWTVDVEWWGEAGRVWRDYLAVTTTTGLLCVLYHDRCNGTWRLVRVYD